MKPNPLHPNFSARAIKIGIRLALRYFARDLHVDSMLFENLIHRLADDGVYVIEDIYGPHVRALADYFSAAKYRAQFVQIPTLCATSRKKADLGAMLAVIHHA